MDSAPNLPVLPPEQVSVRLAAVEESIVEIREENYQKQSAQASSLLALAEDARAMREDLTKLAENFESTSRTLVNGMLRMGARQGRMEVKFQETARERIGNMDQLHPEKQEDLRELRDRLDRQSLRTKEAHDQAARARQDSAHAIEEAQAAQGKADQAQQDAAQAKKYVLHLTKSQAAGGAGVTTLLGAAVARGPEILEWLIHLFK